MPYKTSKYHRCRQIDPDAFIQTSFKTVPVSHNTQTKYLQRQYPEAKIVTGKLKLTQQWKVQSILIPLQPHESPFLGESDPFCQFHDITPKKG